jgi:hypothetical protein
MARQNSGLFFVTSACPVCQLSHKQYYQPAAQARAVTLAVQKVGLSQGANNNIFSSGANKTWNYFKAPTFG